MRYWIVRRWSGISSLCDSFWTIAGSICAGQFDLFLPNAFQWEQFKGKDLRLFAEYRVKYPFHDLKTDTNLHAFGNIPQPFICYLCEGNTTGEQDSLYLVEILAGIAARRRQLVAARM